MKIAPLVLASVLLIQHSDTLDIIDSEFLQLVPVILNTAEAQHFGHHHRPKDRGALLIDVDALVKHGNQVTERPLPRAAVVTVLENMDRRFLDLTHEQAINCTEEDGGPYCFMLDNGLHVWLQSLARTEGGYEALVQFRYQDRGFGATCGPLRRLEFSREDGEWEVADRELVRTC